MSVVTSTQAKTRFGEYLEKIQKKDQTFVISKNGVKVGAMIPIDDYEDYLEVKDEKFENGLKKTKKDMEKGEKFGIEVLYEAHKKKIKEEAKSEKLK